ncbi:hypothetical protein FEF26_04910 [Nesterenkonia salmonea]|uniref:DUF3558 domain-containing protein n=1 Tax=Nesterenkonia salmonea TaxID=1804987 RepID=A0A5R9BE04_9MICC|nr:hypothetical protein [Nesterenkonia salmonea]TLP98499.1 hypothetical protein FEF26_04910 [Nesterenkonia salmonea]
MRLRTPFAAVVLSTLALAGCGNSSTSDGDNQPSPAAETETNGASPEAETDGSGAEEPDSQNGSQTDSGDDSDELNIPQEWITRTADAWPESQGFAQHAPVQELTDECLLFDEEPDFFDEPTQFRFSGFGSYGRPTTNYGNEPSTEDSFRYLCSLARADDQRAENEPSWAPNAQLMVTDSVEHAEQTVTAFLDQPDLPERVNDIQTIQAHGTEIHTVEREFPTNPGNGGELEAVFYDADAGAIVKLRLHSMDEDLRAEHGGQGVAEDLARLLLEGQ